MNHIRNVVPDKSEMDIPGDEPEMLSITKAITDAPDNRAVDKILAFVVTFVPPLAFALGIYLHVTGWYQISWVEIFVLVLMHTLAVAGVELGYHRLFAHRSYTPNRAVKIILAGLGSMGFQGPVIWWAATHRKHHRYSDRPNDPHSMYIRPDGRTEYNKGFWQLCLGFIHSHIGWIWTPASIRSAGWGRYVRDLYRDKDILKIHINYLYFLLLGFIIPGVIAGLLHQSWQGVFLGVLWGGFIRIFTMNHLTYWTINNISHSVGARPYKTADYSTNSVPLIFALPTFGQSYHNNHHAFPYSWRMCYEWYEFDIGIYVLKFLHKCGWIEEYREPSAKQRELKRNHKGASASEEQEESASEPALMKANNNEVA